MPRVVRSDTTSNTASSVGRARRSGARRVGRKQKATVAQLAKQVKKLSRETKPEVKFTFSQLENPATARVFSGASLQHFAGIFPVKGTSDNERIGDRIRAKSMDLRMTLRSALPDGIVQSLALYPSGAATARIIVVRLKEEDEAATWPLSIILDTTAVGTELTQPLSWENRHKYSVLVDEVVYLGVPQPGQVNSTTTVTNDNTNYFPDGLPLGVFLEKKIALNMEVQLGDGENDAYASMNGLAYVVLTDYDNSVMYNWAQQFLYTDV